MRNLMELYSEAIEIEGKSQSPRIKELRKKGKHCKISLGIVDFSKTKYLFVLANPGVDKKEMDEYEFEYKQDVEKTVTEHRRKYNSMKTYIEICSQPGDDCERLACRLKKFITAFNDKIGVDTNEFNEFGVINTSIFHSRTTKELQESFALFVETAESFELIRENFFRPNLKMIVFSGVDPTYFFYRLYASGSKVTNLKKKIRIGRFHFDPFWITQRAKREVLCIFTVHLTGTRGLSTDNIQEMAGKSAELLRTKDQK